MFRNWHSKIVQERRKKITKKLQQNLFFLDPVFGPRLMQHRSRCRELERLRVIALEKTNGEGTSFTLAEFQAKQQEVRDMVKFKIEMASKESRKLFESGIQIVIEGLVKKHQVDTNKAPYLMETASDQADGDQAGVGECGDPLYEQLGFRGPLAFPGRSEVRESCQRFLRLSFLFDFIALESLSQIYLRTIEESISKLQAQLMKEVDYELRGLTEEERITQGALTQTTEGLGDRRSDKYVPVFKTEVQFRPRSKEQMPRENLYYEEIETFELPPLGYSKKHEFNPVVHLELEQEIPKEGEAHAPAPKSKDKQDASSSGEDSPSHSEQEATTVVDTKRTPDAAEQMQLDTDGRKPPTLVRVMRVRDIQSLWLSLNPKMEDIQELLQQAFRQGFDCLRNFERWSMHDDLAIYDQILEAWDYRSYTKWEIPEAATGAMLDCEDWLSEERAFIFLESNIESLVRQTFAKVSR